MKGDVYVNAQLKYKVLKAKLSGKKELIWSLRTGQAEFLRDLGYAVEPELYTIETRTWHDLTNKSGILKELHFLRKRGKKTCVKKLSRRDLDLLFKYGVRVRVLKYRIILK